LSVFFVQELINYIDLTIYMGGRFNYPDMLEFMIIEIKIFYLYVHEKEEK